MLMTGGGEELKIILDTLCHLGSVLTIVVLGRTSCSLVDGALQEPSWLVHPHPLSTLFSV